MAAISPWLKSPGISIYADDGCATKSYVDGVVGKPPEELLMWGDILQAAKTDPGLDDLLNRVKEYYILRKE